MHIDNIPIIKEILLDEVTIRLREDGIVHVYFHAHAHITVAMQTLMIEAYWKLISSKCAFIFEGGEFVSLSKEARENAYEIEESTPVLASVIVVHNLAQKIIADYYYKFNRPRHPLKVFRNFDAGIDWLKVVTNKSQ